jgi:phosphatidylserine synthase 2
MGLLLSYSVFMTFILILPLDTARYIFKIFHPSQGNEMPERGYADDCRVFTPENPVSNYFNIMDAVFDVHFIAHITGWWFKMMIIRDTKIAWIISGSFELIEISLRHWMPNFWECWWDHVSKQINYKFFSSSSIYSDAICLVLFLEP